MTANASACGPPGLLPMNRVYPARTPGPLGVNDHGDPSILALMGDTPGTLALFVVGIVMDLYAIAVANKRWRQVLKVASGWAGATAGAAELGALGAELGSVEPGLGTAIGGIYGSLVGGIAGDAGASWAAKATYDYVDELYCERLAPSAP